MDTFKEGDITFLAQDKQTRDSKVFFNPSRKFERDLNILLVKALGKTEMDGADLFSASGVRGLRLSSETESFRSMLLNDIHTLATINKNIKTNAKKLHSKVTSSSLNVMDVERSTGLFDYIDIDPFGSPVFYAARTMNNIRLGGVMAFTSTDTAALYGRAKKACALKYRAVSSKTSYYNELGLRILLKRIDEAASFYSKSIEPIFFDVRKHYVRAYAKINRIKATKENGMLYQCTKCPNRTLSYAEKCDNCGAAMNALGPIWTGRLFDRKLVEKMSDMAVQNNEKEYLETMKNEKDTITYYTSTEIASYLKHREQKTGTIGSKTCLNPKGFRTDKNFKDLLRSYKAL